MDPVPKDTYESAIKSSESFDVELEEIEYQISLKLYTDDEICIIMIDKFNKIIFCTSKKPKDLLNISNSSKAHLEADVLFSILVAAFKKDEKVSLTISPDEEIITFKITCKFDFGMEVKFDIILKKKEQDDIERIGLIVKDLYKFKKNFTKHNHNYDNYQTKLKEQIDFQIEKLFKDFAEKQNIRTDNIVKSFENQIQEVNTLIKQFNMDSEKTKLANLINDVNAEKTKLTNLINDTNAEKTKLTNLINDVNAEKTKLTNLINDVTAEKAKLVALTGQMNIKGGEITGLVNQMASKTTEITNLNNQMASKNTDITSLNNQMAVKTTDINTLKTQMLNRPKINATQA
jgi:hypothetical protein